MDYKRQVTVEGFSIDIANTVHSLTITIFVKLIYCTKKNLFNRAIKKIWQLLIHIEKIKKLDVIEKLHSPIHVILIIVFRFSYKFENSNS